MSETVHHLCNPAWGGLRAVFCMLQFLNTSVLVHESVWPLVTLGAPFFGNAQVVTFISSQHSAHVVWYNDCWAVCFLWRVFTSVCCLPGQVRKRFKSVSCRGWFLRGLWLQCPGGKVRLVERFPFSSLLHAYLTLAQVTLRGPRA